nr:RNA-binding protein [Methanolobus chelungpuianus]
MRAIAHSTEDPARVRKALDFFLLPSPEGEDRNTDDIVEVIDAEGHYGNRMTIFSAHVPRKKDLKALAAFIRQHMLPEDVELLREEMPDRLDDDQVFHIRLDKQAAFGEQVKLTSSSDAIIVRVKIETYPKNRQKAGLIVEELFG